MAVDHVTTDIAVGAPPRVEQDARRAWTLSPAAIVLAVAAFAAALVRVGVSPYGFMAGASLGVLVVLSAIDLQARILPNRILLPATAALLAAQAVFYPEHFVECVLAALAAGALMLAPGLVDPAAVGMGDVKLAVFLGVLLGSAVAPALILGCLATAPVLAVLLVRRGRAARRATLPLGPFLTIGTAIVVLAP